MKKILLTLFLLSSFVVFSPKTTHAQACGTYTCAVNSGTCILAANNCTNGGVATDSMCENLLVDSCDNNVGYGAGVHACVCPYGSTPINWTDLYNALPGFKFAPGSNANSNTLGNIVFSLTGYLFPIAGLLLLLYLIYGGYMFLTSAGDPQKAQTAKGIITMALIGFLIIFTSYWIVQIAGIVLGLPDISAIFSS